MSDPDFTGAVMLFGDSLTQAWSDGSFAQRMSEHYIRRADVINRGFSGYNSEWAIPVFEQVWATKDAAAAGKAQEVKLLTVWLGANDAVLPGNAQHVPLARFKANVLHILNLVRWPSSPYHSPDTRLLLISPPPVIESARLQGRLDKWAAFGKAGPAPAQDRERGRTREFAEAIVALGKEEGVPTVDLWSAIVRAGGGEGDEQLAPFFYDGLHLTSAGYKVLFDEITALISSTWPDLDPENMAMRMPHKVDPANPRAALGPFDGDPAKAYAAIEPASTRTVLELADPGSRIAGHDDVPTAADLAKWDREDPLGWTRAEFEMPSIKACGGDLDGKAIYFCGNSLGLLSKKARQHVIEELDVWSTRAVTGHFDHPHARPWKHVDDPLTPHLARLVGAREDEVAHSSTLTSNLHMLFTTFYRPTAKRWRIVIEKGSFPSDWSHPQFHAGVLSPEQIANAVVALEPRAGEETLRTEDILKTLDEYGDSYYTGQLFDIPPLTSKARHIGALFGLDMAHGIGNVKTELDAWGVDFAVWCTYKYLNAGPGAVGGYFIRDGLDDGGRRLAGWWGNDSASRFEMAPTFRPTPGARGYQHSNTNVLGSVPLLATLELIDRAGFDHMLAKQARLTGALERLLQASRFYMPGGTGASGDERPAGEQGGAHPSAAAAGPAASRVGFQILTPAMPHRGTQLSLAIYPLGNGAMPRVFTRMLKRGLVGDERQPSVIRLSPVVLYNTFTEVGRAVRILEEALAEEEAGDAAAGAALIERDIVAST